MEVREKLIQAIDRHKDELTVEELQLLLRYIYALEDLRQKNE